MSVYNDGHAEVTDMTELTFTDRGVDRLYGWRAARNGRWYVDILMMGFNYRVVLTDAEDADAYGDFAAYNGHGWCFPKILGLAEVLRAIYAWEIDPVIQDATHVPPPPGPWVRDTFRDVSRPEGKGSIFCKRCGWESQDPAEVARGYCGKCHDWT
jgi:hypothetical protein